MIWTKTWFNGMSKIIILNGIKKKPIKYNIKTNFKYISNRVLYNSFSNRGKNNYLIDCFLKNIRINFFIEMSQFKCILNYFLSK